MALALDIVHALVFGLSEHKPAHIAESPFLEVDSSDWKRFAKLFVNEKNDVTEHFRYGIFGMTVRRLCDVGLMVDPTHTASKSGRLVWLATWVPPWTLRTFLADHGAQYETFTRSMRGYADERSLRDLIGIETDVGVCTLSGLLAVAHRAGIQGLESWTANEKERADFSHTTELFQATNGIF